MTRVHRKPTARQVSGARGEQLAADFLIAQGLTLLARNFRSRFGELDLVALSPECVLVIVEVRYRADGRSGGAAGSVDVHKQRRLTLATRALLAARPRLARYPLRFDVIAIEADQVSWIRQAFDAT